MGGGLPKPIGPYSVSFADLELRRTAPLTEGVHGRRSEAEAFAQENSNPNPSPYPSSEALLPLMRVFYPSSSMPQQWSSHRSWTPSLMYTYGYVSKLVPPITFLHRLLIWILSAIIHLLVCLGATIHASVNNPILPIRDEAVHRRFPVVIFSHGMWSCRTTYSAFCCDLASHGYIVVALEHLDGSANMASYRDHYGKRRWLENSFAKVPPKKISMQDRSKQLRQRVAEVCKVVDSLESLDRGLLTQNSNTVTGKVALDVGMLRNRLDLRHIAIAGHSFGGATAIVASSVDKRFKCCLGMDVWWDPIEKVDSNMLAGKVPVLLLNTHNFDWKALREARLAFLRARARAKNDDQPLITQLLTVKDTHHQDQSDFTLLFPRMMKALGFAGTLDPLVTKNINSRSCLSFLHKYLLPPGTGFPYYIAEVKADEENILAFVENLGE